MNLTVYYNSEITQDLSRTTFILEKAGFDADFILYKNEKEIDSVTNQDKFIICINDTWSLISEKLSKLYDIPQFEFSSKKYTDNNSEIFFYSIPLTSEAMYDDSYKKYTWKIMTDCFKAYDKYVKKHGLNLIVEEVSVVPPPIETKSEVLIVSEPIIELLTKLEDTTNSDLVIKTYIREIREKLDLLEHAIIQ